MKYLGAITNDYDLVTKKYVDDAAKVIQTLTSGTAIGSVGGTTLYAPAGGSGTITSVKTTAGAHTAINVSSGAANFNVPTKTSHLTNDSGFLTSHQTVYESKINWGNTSISGNVTPMGASLSSEHSANRIAYLNPAAIQIEYTTNGGSSWADSGYTDTEKTWLCTGNQNIAVGQSKSGYSQSTALTTNHWTRITLTGQNGTTGYVYTAPKKLLVNMSTALLVECLVERKTGVSGANWETFGTYTVSGWSGWNDIPLVLGSFGGGTTQTSNTWYLRFTFKIASTRTDSYKGMSFVQSLRLFGSTDWGSASSSNGKGPFSSTGHLYSYDVNANATFPAKVTASGGFSGNLTGNVTGSAGSVAWSGVGSKPTTLSGYGITDAKIASGTITLGSNTITPLTSYTETDPVFTASAAHGISSSDISSWNGKSTVSLNRKTTTGTNIADITIDGTTTQLYAPTSGGGSGTITKVKTTAGTHTAIDVSSGAANFNVPTKTSHLTNDSGFTTNTGTITGVTAGTGLSGGGTSGSVTLNHSNLVTAGTIGSSSASQGSTVAIPYATYDSNGHITGKGTHTHTITGFLSSSDIVYVNNSDTTSSGVSANTSNWTYTSTAQKNSEIYLTPGYYIIVGTIIYSGLTTNKRYGSDIAYCTNTSATARQTDSNWNQYARSRSLINVYGTAASVFQSITVLHTTENAYFRVGSWHGGSANITHAYMYALGIKD